MRMQRDLAAICGATAALGLLTGCSAEGIGQPGSARSVQASRGDQSVQPIVAGLLGRAPNVLAPSMQYLIHGSRPIRGFVSAQIKAPGGATAFVSDYTNGAVYVLNASGKITATLTGFSGPEGLAVDKSGDLYVANTNSSTILKLAPPYTGKRTTFNDPNELPVDVAVDGNGNLAVTNIYNTNGNGGGNVVFYTAGATNPTGSASSPTFTSPRFCSFDARGNLILDDDDEFNTGVVNVGGVLHGAKGDGKITTLQIGNLITIPGGVQVTGSGQIAVGDQEGTGSGPAIYSYNAPTSSNLGSPVSTTLLTGSSEPVGFAFLPGSTLVLSADAALDATQLFRFPAGGSALQTIDLPNGGVPVGVATNPSEQFTRS